MYNIVMHLTFDIHITIKIYLLTYLPLTRYVKDTKKSQIHVHEPR